MDRSKVLFAVYLTICQCKKKNKINKTKRSNLKMIFSGFEIVLMFQKTLFCFPALSYAQVADSSAAPKDPSLDHSETLPCYLSENFEICNDFPKPTYTENELCPYLAHGACPNMEQCCYVHGDVCEMCGLNVLHPTDVEQRQKHEMVSFQENPLFFNWVI